jgi:hypothetical protein
MANHKKRTRQEIAELKENWLKDPCWDIEDTEGFEAHKPLLLKFRHDVEKEQSQKHREQVKDFMSRVGLYEGVDAFTLAEYIMNLEARLKKCEASSKET